MGRVQNVEGHTASATGVFEARPEANYPITVADSYFLVRQSGHQVKRLQDRAQLGVSEVALKNRDDIT